MEVCVPEIRVAQVSFSHIRFFVRMLLSPTVPLRDVPYQQGELVLLTHASRGFCIWRAS
ncbi:MAG: hypothetical protein ACXWP6_07700 [Ktedonobacterales bacterium]